MTPLLTLFLILFKHKYQDFGIRVCVSPHFTWMYHNVVISATTSEREGGVVDECVVTQFFSSFSLTSFLWSFCTCVFRTRFHYSCFALFVTGREENLLRRSIAESRLALCILLAVPQSWVRIALSSWQSTPPPVSHHHLSCFHRQKVHKLLCGAFNTSLSPTLTYVLSYNP